MKVFVDACYMKKNEAYLGVVMEQEDNMVSTLHQRIQQPVSTSQQAERYALAYVLEHLEKHRVEDVQILCDAEQLVSQLHKWKKGMETGSFTPPNGFERSLSYKMVQQLIHQPNWSLVRIPRNENKAHEVSRKHIKEYKR